MDVNYEISRFYDAINYLIDNNIVLRKSDLSKSFGISPSKFSEILKKRMKPSIHLFSILTEKYNINPEWLLTGKGPMLREGVAVPAEQVSNTGKSIPLIPTDAFAGTNGMPVQITESMIEDRYLIPEWKDVDFLIRVFGNSMHPTYYSGDIVACKQIVDKSFFSWGKIYVLHHNDYGVMIKRLFPGSKQGTVICRSDNSKEYPDFELDLANVTNIALVVGGIKHE